MSTPPPRPARSARIRPHAAVVAPLLAPFFGLLLGLAAASGAHAADTHFSGTPRVIAGDLLEVAGERLRLAGIDAPEPGQRCTVKQRTYDCGRISATALMDLTAGVEVTCTRLPDAVRADTAEAGIGTPARCFADGYDLSEGMVYTGWALADPVEGGRYKGLESGAKAARRGLWRGSFEAPWAWRAKSGSD